MLTPAVIAEVRALETSGALTPQRLLERAQDPTSALHGEFEWDDRRAAHAHRLVIAERLIIRVRVRIEGRPDAEPRKVRVRTDPPIAARPSRPAPPPRPVAPPPPPMSKKPVLTVVEAPNPDNALWRALNELAPWRMQWGGMPELAGLMRELDRLDRHVKLLDAVRHARELEARGYARPEAAAQAASMFYQPREEVLRLLRAS